MKYLFFDTESANAFGGLAKICSLGYVLTDEHFNIIEEDDLIMCPEARWDMRVLRDILYYDMDFYDSYPSFPHYYEKIKQLFNGAIVFGHAVRNDVCNLSDAFLRYNLAPIDYKFYDTQRIYMAYMGLNDEIALNKVSEALGIEMQDEKHRSVQDARISMLSLKKIYEELNLTLKEIVALSDHSSGTYINGEISKFDNNFLVKIPAYNRSNGRANSQIFNYLLDNIKVTEDRAKDLAGKNICISLNYEEDHFIEMLYIIQDIYNRGGTYTKGASRCNLYLRYDKLDEDGNKKECIREHHIDIEKENGNLIEKHELNDFLSTINMDNELIRANYFKIVKEMNDTRIKEREKQRKSALKEDRRYRDAHFSNNNDSFGTSLGDALKELLK